MYIVIHLAKMTDLDAKTKYINAMIEALRSEDAQTKINIYCTNMIEYSRRRILELKQLIKTMSASTDDIIIRDVKIQDDQFQGTAGVINKANVSQEVKDRVLPVYGQFIGKNSEDVMGNDYKYKARTISYKLLKSFLSISGVKLFLNVFNNKSELDIDNILFIIYPLFDIFVKE